MHTKVNLLDIMVYEQTLTIPQDILASACLTLDDLKVELAVHLYEEGRLCIVEDFELDLKNLQELGRL